VRSIGYNARRTEIEYLEIVCLQCFAKHGVFVPVLVPFLAGIGLGAQGSAHC